MLTEGQRLPCCVGAKQERTQPGGSPPPPELEGQEVEPKIRLDGPSYPAGQAHYRVAMSVPHDMLEEVQVSLLNAGFYVERGRYQGESVGGSWLENVAVAIDAIEKPGAIFATVELVRRVINTRRRTDALPDFTVHHVDPALGSELTCSTCRTTYRFTQLQHAPVWCPDVRCEGRLNERATVVDSESEADRLKRWRASGAGDGFVAAAIDDELPAESPPGSPDTR